MYILGYEPRKGRMAKSCKSKHGRSRTLTGTPSTNPLMPSASPPAARRQRLVQVPVLQTVISRRSTHSDREQRRAFSQERHCWQSHLAQDKKRRSRSSRSSVRSFFLGGWLDIGWILRLATPGNHPRPLFRTGARSFVVLPLLRSDNNLALISL